MQWNRHHLFLLDLMNHVHGREDNFGLVNGDQRFPKETLFSDTKLSRLLPTYTCKFFAKKVIGRDDLKVDDNPSEGI